jgi:hypothetical protein
MLEQKTTTRNVFLKAITEGTIRNLQQLKSSYRTLVMRTHPDALGSDQLIDKFMTLSSNYQEARAFLEAGIYLPSPTTTAVGNNSRLAFYQALQRLQVLDAPYTFHRAENQQVIAQSKRHARECFAKWNGDCSKLYGQAQQEYDRLKAGKPSGPYLKNALALNVSPVFHNIIAYHLTGIGFYKKQVKQNLQAILQRLVDGGYCALRDFIQSLIDDMDSGPAVYGDSMHRPVRIRLEHKSDR